ncbi:hypothetical protein K3495_g1699 [Podosphaera aphanis]|nr:hypothetical protein K3495_g1699 [Podosphaera aphanis]
MSAEENTFHVSGDSPHGGKIISLLDQLMEEGQRDEEICLGLARLAKELNDDSMSESGTEKRCPPTHPYVDTRHLEHILGYMDLRRSQVVRSHATLTVSAYLKATRNASCDKISNYFYTKNEKGTPDDYILAFSVATSLFPIVPDSISMLFLGEGFISKLKVLMKNQKDGFVGRAIIELLNAACMSTPCRDAIRSLCTEWLEDLVLNASETSMTNEKSKNINSEYLRDIAAIVLAKLQATPSAAVVGSGEYVRPASISIEKLSDDFKNMLFSGSAYQYSIEGLAYSSLQPNVKEKLIADQNFLPTLLKVLREAEPKSPLTYGALSILFNLTSFKPKISDEQKRLAQLKFYASASNPSESDQFEQDEFVLKRCQAVFDAGIVPILVTHSQYGSASSLILVVSILNSLSRLKPIRGKMAQQGAIKLLTHAYTVFPTENDMALRITAHALARVLISTNPFHAFGGSNPNSITSAIRPLIHILSDDPALEQRDLLPLFESLLALTNLASTDDTTRNSIIRHTRSLIDDILLSDNTLVTRAAVELICNLVISSEGVVEYSEDHRIHILLALTDAEDPDTRKGAGGALATLTGWEKVIEGILRKDNGVRLLLALCVEDDENLRHRGVVCILNIVSAPGELGKQGAKIVREEGGIQSLKQSLRSRQQAVLDSAVKAMKVLMQDQEIDLNLLNNS